MKFMFLFYMIMVAHLTGISQDEDARDPGKPLEVVDSGGIRIPVYDFNGFREYLSLSNDTTYVINFWATWCKPCVEELPGFRKVQEELRNEKVSFIFVSLDFRKNLESGLIPFLKSKGYPQDVVMLHDPDANSWIDQVDPGWSGAIPATLIYRDSKKQFYEQSFSSDQLFKAIQSFIQYNYENN